MKKFDWSKVTARKLQAVPASVTDEFWLILTDVRCASGACVLYERIPGDVAWLMYGASKWVFEANQWNEEDARRAIACIDRIANYLTIHWGDS